MTSLKASYYTASPTNHFIVSDKAQAMYWIRLTATYHSSHVAGYYCLEAHDKALNDTIGNFTQPYLNDCINNAGGGNISISNITSISRSFDVSIHFASLS
jgi:hypothetical protein